ncbi:MAG: serine/threonine-protein kinase [Truepera sp.]|nr:serine/threonine-protein kinase [Truepera sp.]
MFNPGDVIDERYEVTGVLGQGGMAHVFHVRDPILERDAAVKVLRPHLTEADSGRFRREIRALAQLNHPGVVSIFDLGRSDLVYFVMELVAGGMVTDLGPLEGDTEALTRLLDAAIEIADTLGYIHRLGMVHRDLTPRNILLTSSGRPKVMDFGLVLLAETSKSLTRTGLTLGTPHYMAPEQAIGQATGFQVDLYAFGAVLYKMVTGSTPFDADNDQAVLYHHVYTELTPARELNPETPEDLERLLGRLLAKTPESRPTSAYAVADTLRSIRYKALSAKASEPLGGPSRLGVYPEGPAATLGLSKRWAAKLASGPQWPSGLSVGEGFLLVGQRGDSVTSLWPPDGSVHLEIATSDEVHLPPLVHRRQLYIASRDGGFQVHGWPEGNAVLSQEGSNLAGMLPYGLGIVFAISDGRIEYQSPAEGRAWKVALPSGVTAPPIAHRGTLLVTTDDGWLYCLDALSGKERLRVKVGTMRAAPTAHRGVVLLAERDGALHAFNLDSHEVLWTYDLGGDLWASPAAWRGLVFATSWDKDLRCLAHKTGDDVWACTLPGAVTGTPVVADGILYLTTESGHLLGFDARSGEALFEEQVSASPIQASPLVAAGRVYVASLDGTVTAFEA